ncbi:MAG: hypothetical protein ACRYFK_18890 [Janthinobacterium lividum]
MHHSFSLLRRAALALAGTLALGACNRAEYAMLPRSASYLGSAPVAPAPRPAAPVAAHPQAAVPAAVAPAPAAIAKASVTRAATVAAPVASAPVAPVAAAPLAPEVAVATVVPAAAPAKLNLVQRLALKKVSKQLNKLAAQSPQLKQRDAAAGTARVSGNLRSAIIFGIIGLLLTFLGGIAGIFYVLGVIFIIIGLIFLLLWVLDEA